MKIESNGSIFLNVYEDLVEELCKEYQRMLDEHIWTWRTMPNCLHKHRAAVHDHQLLLYARAHGEPFITLFNFKYSMAFPDAVLSPINNEPLF